MKSFCLKNSKGGKKPKTQKTQIFREVYLSKKKKLSRMIKSNSSGAPRWISQLGLDS